MYVSQLSKEEQQAIRAKLTAHLTEEGYSTKEINEAVENAMNSKVTDLSDALK